MPSKKTAQRQEPGAAPKPTASTRPPAAIEDAPRSLTAVARAALGKRGDEVRAAPKRSDWPRKLKFTREGKYFLGITLGVGFAAINTGNNPLYLILGTMLALIIVSGVMSELSLRTLTVRRRLPARAQVGRAHLVEIEVVNDKKRVPSYAIEVEDLRAGQRADKRCFFLKISPSSTQVAAYRRTPQRRGLERHTGFRIATRFPFGLFEKSREVFAEDELVIYPAVDAVRLPRRQGVAMHGETAASGGGGGEEIHAVRPMRDGDDPRDIYWRKSTNPDAMVLRERAQRLDASVELELDDVREGPDDAAGADRFERRIREIASLATAHVRRGDRVFVVTRTRQRAIAEKSRGLDPVLRFLALLEQTDAPAQPRAAVTPAYELRIVPERVA